MGRGVLIALCVVCNIGAASTLAILNRLILTTGLWKFSYPVTTSLIQHLVTSLLLLGIKCLVSLSPAAWHVAGRTLCLWPRDNGARAGLPSSVPRLSACGGNPLSLSIEESTSNTIRKLLPVAAINMLHLLLANVLLVRVPWSAYLLLYSGMVPLSMVLGLLFGSRSCSPLELLSYSIPTLTIVHAALKLQYDFTAEDICLAVLASGIAATLFHAMSSTMHEYQPGRFASQKTLHEGLIPTSADGAAQSRDDLQTFCSMLYYTTLLSTVLLIPLLLVSGELKAINHFCYVLDIKFLWLLLVAGGLLQGLVFILNWLLVSISPIRAAILLEPRTAFQLILCNSSSLTFQGSADVALSWIFSLWLISDTRSITTIGTTSTRKSSFILRNIVIFGLIYACVNYSAGQLSTSLLNKNFKLTLFADHDSLSNTIPDYSMEFHQTTFKPRDDYLGPRPHVRTIANLSLIVERCHEDSDGVGVDDVVNCLSFLKTSRNKYLYLSETAQGRRAGEQSPQYEHADGSGNTLAHYETTSIGSSPSASSIGTCSGPIFPFHVYWTGPATWRVELFIKAYLYTQNLPCSQLWLWLDSELDEKAVEKMLLEDFIFSRFRELVARGDIVLKSWKFPQRVPLPNDTTIVVGKDVVQDHNGQRWLLFNHASRPISPVVVSDAVRFVVLHLHGGVYCDMDVLLLQDMRPLILPDLASGPRAFAEQWVERCHPGDYNTAVISLPANSSLSSYLLLGGLRMGMNFHPKAIGHMMWRDGRNGELSMLQNAVFDPLVTNLRRKNTDTCTIPCLKNFYAPFMSTVEEASKEWSRFAGNESSEQGIRGYNISHDSLPSTNRSLENFFQGAWAYHIHNQWWKFPDPSSWLAVITEAQDGFFKGQRTNAYGEKWIGPTVESYNRDLWLKVS